MLNSMQNMTLYSLEKVKRLVFSSFPSFVIAPLKHTEEWQAFKKFGLF